MLVWGVQSIRYVEKAWINQGVGIMDFIEELKELKPDIFFVNEDGHNIAKEKLCQRLGIQYVVSKRVPDINLLERSTTNLRKKYMYS